jgi:hypothetical protein
MAEEGWSKDSDLRKTGDAFLAAGISGLEQLSEWFRGPPASPTTSSMLHDSPPTQTETRALSVATGHHVAASPGLVSSTL